MYVQVDLNTSRGVLTVQGEQKDVDELFPSVVEALLLKLPHSIATVRYATKAPILWRVLFSPACLQENVLKQTKSSSVREVFSPARHALCSLQYTAIL